MNPPHQAPRPTEANSTRITAAAERKPDRMRSLNDLDADALKVALHACDALMKHKAYLPPGGLLLMLLGKFRDHIRDTLSMEPEDIPRRGTQRRPLDKLTSFELDTMSGAAGILLQDRFTRVMDDPVLPRLLRELHSSLTRHKTERKQVQAS
ncbi:MAG: hypothetical protein ACRDOI_43970 [Trebonia sp.]